MKIEDLAQNCRDKRWRLANLYSIKDAESGRTMKFVPRREQWEIFEALLRGVRKIIILKARRLGMSTGIDVFAADEVAFNAGVQCSIVDQNQDDASKKLNAIVKVALDSLPAPIRERLKFTRSNDSAVELSTRSSPARCPPQSERGRAGLARYDADFSRRTAVDLVGLASHTMVRRGTDEILAQAERLFASGQDDAAYALCDGLERQGAFTTDQKMAQFAKWKETRRTEFLGARMTHQPREFMQNLDEYIATGHSKDLLESVRDRDEAQGWLQKTRQHFRGVQSTTRREVFAAIGEEKLTRESEVDGGGNLDEEDLVAARKGLAIQHTPVDYPVYGRLRLAALAYDAAADTDGSGLAALDREIVAGVPGPQAARLLQQAREPDSPARRRQAALFRKVESHATSGHLGETGRDAEGTIVDAPKARNVAMKAEALRLDLEHFLQKNPEVSPREINDFLREQMKTMGANGRAAESLRKRSMMISQ